MRRHTKTWLGRLGAAVVVTFVLGYVPYHVYTRSGVARTLQLRQELASLRARNQELRAGNDRLAREAEALRGDLDAVERVARAELGWVRPGEMVVDLSGEGSAGAPGDAVGDRGERREAPLAEAGGVSARRTAVP